jgi:putative component of toxin-antitoxin plasmid stabilization module
VPFEVWVTSLKDAKAKLAVYARVERAAIGDFSDWRPIAGAKAFLKCGYAMLRAIGYSTQ